MASPAVKPVYVLHGGDAFLRDRHRREIISLAVGEADPQLCVARFDATAELAGVLDELRTMPFLAPRRVVIVEDADAFITAHRKAMEKYVQAPSATGTLVLAVLAWAKTTNLAKLVAKTGEVRDCAAPAAGRLPGWVGDAARRHGGSIARDAAALLVECVGADLAALDAELEKLATYVGRDREITRDDVGALAASGADEQKFALPNAIVAGDPAAALKALDAMLVRRGEEFRVLGILGWHLRRVLAAQQELAATGRITLRMPPSAERALVEMLRRRPVRRLRGDFRRLLRADLAMKSGAEPVAALQELVVGLCS